MKYFLQFGHFFLGYMFDSWQSSSESGKEFKEPKLVFSGLAEGNVLYQKKTVERRIASFQATSITNFNTASEKDFPSLGLFCKMNGLFFMVNRLCATHTSFPEISERWIDSKLNRKHIITY